MKGEADSVRKSVSNCEKPVYFLNFTLSNEKNMRKMEKTDALWVHEAAVFPFFVIIKEDGHGKTVLETGQHALSPAGGYGELPEAGRETEYYNRGMDRDGLFVACHGIHIGKKRKIFL